MNHIQIPVNTIRRNSVYRMNIAILQAMLADKGYLGWEIDGVFGPVTERAVLAFQGRNDLVQDGIVGPLTWGALVNEVPQACGISAISACGDSKTLTDCDYAKAAESIGVDVATIRAVCEVESSGCGFLSDGRPKILFEGHVFWMELVRVGIDPGAIFSGNKDILYLQWTKAHYKGGAGEYSRLERAMKIHKVAALASASWGLFQIMGYHFLRCGFSNVVDFVDAMYESEWRHLEAFCRFVLGETFGGRALVEYLREKDWEKFAHGYNGSGYQANRYDERLAAAYRKWIVG